MSEHLVTIQDVAFGGDGVARLEDGKVCFVPGVIPGEQVLIGLSDDRSQFAKAYVKEIKQASVHRKPSECAHVPYCAGCQYWHMDYDYEVELKTKQLKDLLARQAGFSEEELALVQATKAKDYRQYRRSATLHVTKGGKIGFYGQDNRSVMNIQECPIADEIINYYLVDNREELLEMNAPDIHLKSDGKEVSFLNRANRLTYEYRQHQFSYDAFCFFQANPDTLTQILDWLQEQPIASEVLFDLYCGVGIFSIALADHFQSVIGLEHARKAVQFGNTNKQDLAHVQILKGKVEEKFRRLYKRYAKEKNTILVDPPRQGLLKQTVNDIADCPNLDQIIYISCSPTTLSRDLKLLRQALPLEITHIHLFDMFPRTKHFETVVIAQVKKD